ncbi:MAG: UDP-N-acetylmuramoyl-L-alanine--D-glutamate ligase [Deferribacteraceae bacterium]|jgi:UDP-N-acetylmuramoylalanine--D-glutamate ligase|nr:UDP-N-acetylmuramoyl-L-alanine--D-glutamate ligase [Deferribacteraceae bacterium]
MNGAVVGYGKSGIAAEKLLKLKGYDDIDLYDDKAVGCLPLREFKDRYDLVVVSPGVPIDRLPELPTSYTSEIDLAYGWMPADCKVLGVTGTNGKSTVTHLTAQILNNAGYKAIACGNIGYPYGEAVIDAEEGTIFVVELSSFQLESTCELSIDAASVTNLTPDHLDRYDSLDSYYGAKLRILQLIDLEGMLIAEPNTNIVNRTLNAMYPVRYVDNELKAWPKLNNNKLMLGRYFVDISKFKLFGAHNIINLTHALFLANAIAAFEGDVTHLIENLQGMPHRVELVLERDGIVWINDSKATNVDSTLVALKSCKGSTVILLGGRDKMGDFTALVNELNRAASHVLLFGEAAATISKQLKGKLKAEITIAETLHDAVNEATKVAGLGSTVILSPGCASYDEFSGFEERGREFARYVKEAVNA